MGVLLAAAFLDILSQAAQQLSVQEVGVTVLVGICAFFVLEKTALWRHDHACQRATAVPPPAGAMIVLGYGLHNFVDGMLIAAACLQDPALGIATAIAVITHEIPQELGDFVVLLAAGYSRQRALLFNAISGLAAVAGGMLGYLVLQSAQGAIP